MPTHRTSSLLRQRTSEEASRVNFVELFFDLVFVFCITQLSHALIHHYSAIGLAETGVLMLAVWWVWLYTSWVTNWLDPRRTLVRLLLFVLMLAGLMMAVAIPEALEQQGLLFAGAYVFIQVGRSLFMCYALKGHNPGNYRNFLRITVWLSVSGLIWLAGGLSAHETRFVLWCVALFIETISPIVYFWTPGMGRSTSTDWDISGAHLAERCGLFIIIVLGESILVTGATFAELPWDICTLAAFLVAFLGSVAMWWIYFHIGAERASSSIAHSADPGGMARLKYNYPHVPIVAGIILGAVADEFILKDPLAPVQPLQMAAILGGPALFLIGNTLFKRFDAPHLPLSHLVGLLSLAALLPLYTILPLLAMAGLAALVLIIVAFWEHHSIGGTYFVGED